jgi:6-phosphogluconate dehydrogenase
MKMNNKDRDAIVVVINKLQRNNKKTLSDLINKSSHNLNTLKVLVAALLPSQDECKHLVDETAYDKAAQNIAIAIYITHSPEKEHSKDSVNYAAEVIAVVKSAMKKDRKATEDLYVKSVKTNLTQAEYDKIQHLRKSLNYSSIAAFVRDAAIQALDVKPRQEIEFQQHFEETAKLSRSLRHISENLDDKDCLADLPLEINALKKEVDIARRMVVESHSSSTAKLLAERFLSARQLEIILKKKLEEEKNQ